MHNFKWGPSGTRSDLTNTMVSNASALLMPDHHDKAAAMEKVSPSTANFVYAAEAYIQPIILIFGFLTNIASAVVLRKVRMNEVFRICLLALSIVDAVACFTGFIQLVIEVAYFDGNINQGYMDPRAIASNTLYFMYLMFMCTSASIVVTIAIIRNMFVLKPMKARAYFTSGMTKLVCFIAFLVTFVLFAPVSLKIMSQSCEKETRYFAVCEWMNSTDPTLHRVGQIYLHYFIAALYGPVTIIVYVICFICIRVTVSKSIKTLTLITPRTSTSGVATHGKISDPGNDVRARSKTAARITKTLLLILLLDAACTLPYVIQGVGLLFARGKSIFNDHGDAGMIYDAIVEIFLNLRPTYNFWLYVYQHPEFRIRTKSIIYRIINPFLKSKCCRKCYSGEATAAPVGSPVAWSMSATPGGQDQRAPWFKRLSSKLQNGNEFLAVPTYPVAKYHLKETLDKSRKDSLSMESSESDYGGNISFRTGGH